MCCGPVLTVMRKEVLHCVHNLCLMAVRLFAAGPDTGGGGGVLLWASLDCEEKGGCELHRDVRVAAMCRASTAVLARVSSGGG